MIYLFKYWKYFGEIAKMVYASDWNSEDLGSIPNFPTKYGVLPKWSRGFFAKEVGELVTRAWVRTSHAPPILLEGIFNVKEQRRKFKEKLKKLGIKTSNKKKVNPIVDKEKLIIK